MKTTILKSLAVLLVALVLAPATFADNYVVNTSASSVKWLGKKVGGEHYGKINVKNGSLDVVDGVVKGGTISIDMQSMTCDDITDEAYNQKLIGHLKSDDFFSVETSPTAKLILTDVKKSGNNFTFTGNLTIKGITNPVSFEATSAAKGEEIKFEGKITIDRSKYNVKYGSTSFFDNLGDKVIYDEFTLDFVLIAKK